MIRPLHHPRTAKAALWLLHMRFQGANQTYRWKSISERAALPAEPLAWSVSTPPPAILLTNESPLSTPEESFSQSPAFDSFEVQEISPDTLGGRSDKSSGKREYDSKKEKMDKDKENIMLAEPPTSTRRLKKGDRMKTTETLLYQFDVNVFDRQLSDHVEVKWSNTLRTTAGITRLLSIASSNRSKANSKERQRRAVVELATKVVDDEQRLRETLLHELCHAAAWVVDGVDKPPHGEAFRRWGARASAATGLPVTRCHNYEIEYRHNWVCTHCGAVIGRHSKSVDVTRQVCGACRGTLEYAGRGTRSSVRKALKSHSGLPIKERSSTSQNPWTIFVKSNYQSTRQRLLDSRPQSRSKEAVGHSEIMKSLSVLWALSNEGSR